MTALVLTRDTEQGPRPLDILRDLDGIGKLVDLAFADDVARDGTSVSRDLAMLSLSSPFLWTLRRISPEARDSFDGFVWVEDGEIVGNVTLTRDDLTRLVWTVTNVAVHPRHRRRGIARDLMGLALGAVSERGGGPVALEVKPGNTPAYRLYQSLGFRFVDSTLTLRAAVRPQAPGAPSLDAGPARPDEMDALFHLVQEAASADARRLAPLHPADFGATLGSRLAAWGSALGLCDARSWYVTRSGQRLAAAARLTGRRGGTTRIRLYVHPEARGSAEAAVISAALAGCRRAGTPIIATLSEADLTAHSMLLLAGFVETRRLHRLVIDA